MDPRYWGPHVWAWATACSVVLMIGGGLLVARLASAHAGLIVAGVGFFLTVLSVRSWAFTHDWRREGR
jgi:hypothetical protein